MNYENSLIRYVCVYTHTQTHAYKLYIYIFFIRLIYRIVFKTYIVFSKTSSKNKLAREFFIITSPHTNTAGKRFLES